MPVTVNPSQQRKPVLLTKRSHFLPYFLANDLGALELEPALESIDNGGTAWSLFGIPECPDTTGDRQTFQKTPCTAGHGSL